MSFHEANVSESSLALHKHYEFPQYPLSNRGDEVIHREMLELLETRCMTRRQVRRRAPPPFGH